MKTISIFFILSTLILSSCSTGNECGSFEALLIGDKLKLNESKPISLDSISKGNWDRVGVFHGPVFPQEVEKRLGIKYEYVVDDGCREYIFVKGNEVVKEEESCGCNLGYFKFQSGNYPILYDTSIIYLKRTEIEAGTYFQIWDEKPPSSTQQN